MLLFRMILIISVVQVEPFGLPSLGDLWKFTKFAFELGGKIKSGYDVIEGLINPDQTEKLIGQILTEVTAITKKVDALEVRLDIKLDQIVESLVERITLVQKLDASFLELHKMIVRIDDMWENFLSYTKQMQKFNNDTIGGFIDVATGPQQGGLQDLLEQIHRLIVPLRTAHIRDSVFLTLLEEQKATQLITCDQPLSNYGTIYQIYTTLALTELRGYVMTVASYGLKPFFKKGKYIGEMDNADAKFAMRTQNYLGAAKQAMGIAHKDIRRCDPREGWARGRSFLELKRLFQAYIVNEADMAPENTCKYTCEDIGDQTYRDREVDWAHNSYLKPCYGRIHSCWKPADKFSICEAPWEDARRYFWFKTGGKFYGEYSPCMGSLFFPVKWYRGMYKCDYCLCTCDSEKPTTNDVRALSFREARTDHRNSKVMIGVRIIETRGMLHLQVREGTLQPQGTILKGSDRWVPIEKFEDTGYRDLDEGYGSFVLVRNGKWEKLKMGKDYDFIRGSQNILHLDDVSVPEGRVAIGVRFKHVNDISQKTNNPIEIEVLSAPYNYESGSLIVGPVTWINSGVRSARKSIVFNSPDLPTKYMNNVPTLEKNLFVKFRASDVDKDAGSSTVPFFDSQDMTLDPPVPLQGVGLFFKGHKDGWFGGFLAFRIYTLDFTKYLNPQLPTEKQKTYEKMYGQPLYTPSKNIALA
ncbi:uncharacterized protein [Fopius arisanus]|uniref:Uncharacterized protein n=2 Tax=Fopius arisanus TaxID=64838 RepID=A0A9R1TZM4_9HYME|nr:PREDICTED: uncharacterized protein LOC105266033 [Fopius arisanus]